MIERVGRHHRLAGADRPIVDPAEGDDRCAHPLRAEAREGLRVATLGEGGHRQHLGRGDDALAAAAVEANLEHPAAPASRRYGFGAAPTMRRQVGEPARVARFVVVPSEHLDEVAVGHRELRVEDARGR